jgi:hypothetical protein
MEQVNALHPQTDQLSPSRPGVGRYQDKRPEAGIDEACRLGVRPSTWSPGARPQPVKELDEQLTRAGYVPPITETPRLLAVLRDS